MLALCGGVYTPLHDGVGWVLQECEINNWGVYLEITCDLTQPWGILGVWRGLLQRDKLWNCKIHFTQKSVGDVRVRTALLCRPVQTIY